MSINISGHRFPNASFARHGILLAPLARHFKALWGVDFVPDRQYLKVSTPKGTEYRLYPNVNGAHSDPHIVYYMAHNVNTGLTEFMVGGFNWPDIFAMYADDYANLALDFFTYSGITGDEADYEISSKLVGWLAMHGEFGEALSTVGDSWYQAVTSKEFWVTTIFTMMTRGVFKVALRTPKLPTSGSGGPPALPPGAGNTIKRSPPPPPGRPPAPQSPSTQTIKRSPPPPPTPVKTSRGPIHPNQAPSAIAGRTQPMSAAQIRLLRTADDILHQNPIRTSHVLQQPTIFRHIVRNPPAEVLVARIRRSGSLRYSEGATAHYGPGAYTYPAGYRAGSAVYVDVEVSVGVAVERITVRGQQPFFRLVANSENAVPVRFVGTNVSAEMLEKMTKFIGESD